MKIEGSAALVVGGASGLGEASAVLARAFHDDPAWSWVLPDPRRRIVLAIRMHAGVEQRTALRVLDQIGRDRQPDPAFAALHQPAEIAGQISAGEGIDSEAHPAFAKEGVLGFAFGNNWDVSAERFGALPLVVGTQDGP